MSVLETLIRVGFLGSLDVRFARTMARLAERITDRETDPDVMLAAALASRQVDEGHVCVDLRDPPVVVDELGAPIELAWPGFASWREQLVASPLVGVPTPGGSLRTPLVLDDAGRLYLQRLWCHQSELAQALRERALRRFEARDADRLRADLARLFPETDPSFPWQRAAAATAMMRALTIVTGGPGTGKTATVARLLALLVGEALAAGDPPPRILLLAPTGKAAARLTESIEAALPSLELEAKLRAALPRAASTIHRALGTIGSSGVRFRHHAENPLAADAVLVDEASMVDLALMNRLVSAVPPRARLVLLGDRDQLASVEAGSVLGDLCDPAVLDRPRSLAYVQDLERGAGVRLEAPLPLFAPPPGLRDSVVRLVHSRRYHEASGIGRLARAIREQDATAALDLLDGDEFPDLFRVEPPTRGILAGAVEEAVVEGFRPALEAESATEALAALGRFRVLCAHRTGLFGVERLNEEIVARLRDRGLLSPRDGTFPGRAVLVTRNDYTLLLFNGDVGLVMPATGDRERLATAFPAAGGGVREVSPARLPAHETAFAMTVHKTQGSEVDRLVLVLPERSPLVTRELLYTSVTRARVGVTIQATRKTIEEGIATATRRSSGLRDLLWS